MTLDNNVRGITIMIHKGIFNICGITILREPNFINQFKIQKNIPPHNITFKNKTVENDRPFPYFQNHNQVSDTPRSSLTA